MVWITYIPTYRNDGTPVGEAEIRTIIENITNKFGGASVKDGVTGYWIDSSDGKSYQDANLEVAVECENSRLPEVEQTVIEIGRRLDQKAMYLEIRYFDGVRILEITPEA